MHPAFEPCSVVYYQFMDSRTIKAEADFQSHPGDTGTRLGTALLVYMVGVILIVTLLPFHFEWPQRWQVSVGDDPYDAVLNVLLFVPLGFLYRMVTPRGRGSMLLVIVNAAFTLVGYMVAGVRGREVMRYRDAAPRLRTAPPALQNF